MLPVGQTRLDLRFDVRLDLGPGFRGFGCRRGEEGCQVARGDAGRDIAGRHGVEVFDDWEV